MLIEMDIGMAIVGIIGGLVAGMLLMLYWDVAATEHIFLRSELLFSNRLLYPLTAVDLAEFLKQRGLEASASNEEQFQSDSSEWLRSKIGTVKAATFLLGVIVLGSSVTLIPFSGLGVSEASWILVGLAAGACIEHAVWLFARIKAPHEELEQDGRRSAFKNCR